MKDQLLSGCNKTAYKTEGEAYRTVIKRLTDFIDPARQLRVYRCPMCHKWHLTRKEKNNNRGAQ